MTSETVSRTQEASSLHSLDGRLWRVQVKERGEWKTRCSHRDREQAEQCHAKDVWAGYEARIEAGESPIAEVCQPEGGKTL